MYSISNTGARNIISSANVPFWINGGILSAGQTGNYSLVTDIAAFPLNRWVHVAVTYDAPTATMRLYRDGILVRTTTSVPAFSSEPTLIGSHTGVNSLLIGNVDEVRLWNVRLSESDLKKSMFKGPANNASGLVSYYKCNTISDAVLANATGGANGTLVNNPTYVASPIQFGANALLFDGTNDFVQLINNINVGTANFTMEIWVNPSTTNVDMVVANDNNGDVNNQFRLGNVEYKR